MTKIRITGGVYGYVAPNGRFSPKTPLDPPFEVEDSEAERLAALGVAEIVTGGGNGGKMSDNGVDKVTPPTPKKPAEGNSEGLEYDEKTSAARLREIGKAVGLSFPAVGVSKKDMLAALDEHFAAENGSDDDMDGADGSDDESGDLDLGVEAPVV